MAPDDYEAVTLGPTASPAGEPEPTTEDPRPDETPDTPDNDETTTEDTEPVEATTPAEVRPLLGYRDYRALVNLTPVQQSMLQTWMSREGHDHWGYYDRKTWDGFLRQAKAYVPTV